MSFLSVFVSFSGDDIGKKFVDHLFKALSKARIYFFREADDLRKEENISTERMKAIDESIISIIVFSQNYAASWLCLEELVRIVECKEMGKQKVFPAFYDVPPSEVRNHRDKFGEALTGLEQKFGAEMVSKWKEVLTTVANLGGWDLQTDGHGYESKFIDKILEGVKKEVNLAYSEVAKHPVGIHAHVVEILASLHMKANSGDFHMIVFHGEVGVGKKTLAKAIFKQIYRTFDDSHFIDLRSECLNVEGSEALKWLQKQRLEGVSLTEGGLGSKKLLIVVNGVDCESQLKEYIGEEMWFAPGSTIIITTRDIRWLVGTGINYKRYEVVELEFEEALELFSWHAFGKSKVPSEDFVKISNRIVRFVGGRPKELIYLASHFCGRSSVQEWTDDFDKIRKVPHDVCQWRKTLTRVETISASNYFKDDRVIEVEQHVATEEPVKHDPRVQEASSKMAAYEQAQLRPESLASIDQLSFVPKAPGKSSCTYGSRKSVISGSQIDTHNSTDLGALEGKSSDSLYAICQSACTMMYEKMTMFRELPKSHNNVDAIREQAKANEVDGLTLCHPVTNEREKLKESDVVKLAKAHFEANVAKAEVEVARSSVEAADLKALQGSKEFQKAVEEYIQQHKTELVDKFFQTEEGKSRIIHDANYLGRQAMQQEIYDVLGRRAGFDFNEWGLPKILPDLIVKKENEKGRVRDDQTIANYM